MMLEYFVGGEDDAIIRWWRRGDAMDIQDQRGGQRDSDATLVVNCR